MATRNSCFLQGFFVWTRGSAARVRNFISFMLIAVSVMLMGIATQWFRGQTLPLVVSMLAAVVLFVSGLIIHKRGVKQ
jgi:putative flippase GtrA